MSFYDAIRVGASGAADFEVKRSLRFNDNDSAYLSRTPSGAGNRKTFTYSCWFKRGILGTQSGAFLKAGPTSSNYFKINIANDHKLYVLATISGGYTEYFRSTQLFRDISAWYHLVLRWDTTNSTAGDRVRVYLNGAEITDHSGSNPALNLDGFVNDTNQHEIGASTVNSQYWDGYIAEVNLIDGFSYDPSYFGETNAETGQWNPKKYTGSYGTNGFYLNFSDNSGTTATTLGKDYSGNGNNFTPNNFSVAAGVGNDSVEDTPTNNFPTLNPLFMNATETAGTFSEGNLKVVTSGSEYGTALSTFSIRYGKYYWEVKQLGGAYAIHGIVRGSTPNADVFVGYDPNGKLFGFGYQQNGNIKGASGTGTTSNASLASSLATFTTNDIIGFASDISNGTLAIYKNNTGINDDDWIPAVSGYTNNGSYSINFGQQTFSYTPPTGYKALNSQNLPDPTILLPNKHFESVIYTGNGGSQTITYNYLPDWVWIKNRSGGDSHFLMDSVRGIGQQLASDDNSNEANGSAKFTGYTSTGFTLNTSDGSLNSNSSNYVSWGWNAGETDGKTYAVTVVSDSGNKYRFDGYGTSAVTLDLAEGGTYIFDQSDRSNAGHPLRFSTTSNGTHGGGSEYTTGVTTSGTPGSSGAYTQIVVAASAPTLYYYCSVHSGMGGQANTNSTLGSSNFDGTIQTRVKANTTAGFSIITYTGNGSTGSTVGHGLGVKPDAIIIKRRNSSSDWMVYQKEVNEGVSPEDYYLSLNNTNAQTNSIIMLNDTAPTSSVVTLYANSAVNSSSDTYVMYCFSEVAGYSKFGSYEGNQNSDGTFVFLGFTPAFLLIKNADNGTYRNWCIIDTTRTTFNKSASAEVLFANDYQTESVANNNYGQFASKPAVDILSNGFKVREGETSAYTQLNRSNTHIFLAFAESPFKNARAK